MITHLECKHNLLVSACHHPLLLTCSVYERTVLLIP